MKFKITIMVSVMVCLLTIAPICGGKAVCAAEVENLVQIKDTESSVTVEWKGILGESKYVVEVSEDGKNWIVADKACRGTSCQIKDLNSATYYYVRVKGEKQSTYCKSIQVCTSCKSVSTVIQTDATTSSITVSWNAVAGANQYNVIKIVDNQEVVIKEVPGTSTTAVITGYDNKVKFPYSVYVKPVIKMSNGYIAGNEKLNYLFAPCIRDYDAVLVPGKIATPKVTRYYSSLKSAWVDAIQVKYGSGMDYELYTVKGKKVSKGSLQWGGTSNFYETVGGVDAKNFYKIRVRTHSTVGEKTKWGVWSDWAYLANSPDKGGAKKAKKGIKVHWKKCKGATYYTIYASKNEKTGFKKVGKTKKTSIVVKKLKKKKFKKGKKYYFYVVSNYKKGKKVYKSGDDYKIFSVVK